MPATFRKLPRSLGVPAVLRGIAVATVAAVAFMLVLKLSIAGVYRESDPARALSWVPFDASAKANVAALITAANVKPGGAAEAAPLATAAIERDPTRVVALRTLGMLAESRGDAPGARTLMEQSSRLSRREHLTQVWLVNDNYRRGNHVEMIRHFDIASRTSQRVRSLLFPTMVNASVNPDIGRLIAKKLADKPNWWLSFIVQLIATGPQVPQVVTLTRGLLKASVPEERFVIERLFQRLAAANEFDLAWNVYVETGGRSSAMPLELVRDGGFETPGGFGPFEWSFAQSADLNAIRYARPDSRPGSALSLIASGGQSGEMARQMLRLSPGSYRLQMEIGNVPADTFGRPLVKIMCVGGTKRDALFSLKPRGPVETVKPFAGAFTVPPSCRWQLLVVELGGDGAPSDSPPWIDNVTVRPTS